MGSKKKDVNKKSEKKKSAIDKKKIIIISAICLVIIISIVAVFIILNKKKNGNFEVYNLELAEVLSTNDEVKASKIIKQNIVKITNKIDNNTKIIGTGFFIKEGYLVTNSHIIDIYGDISIEYYDGTTTKAYLYSNSIENDLALLKVENVQVKALPFGISSEVEVATDVLAAGYAYNFAGEASISKGVLSAKRESNILTYLQSDVAIDTGSSGGPLFNAKGEVIGINTFVTENRVFALALSSTSAQLIIDVLLENPNVEYLTDSRPSNNINSILVEVGYTDDENLELYNDDEIVNKSKEEHKKELDSLPKTENKNEKEYYCDPGSVLVGTKCVRQMTYQAEGKLDTCKSDYKQQGNECRKTYVENAEVEYPCDGKVTERKTCLRIEEWEQGVIHEERLGSCPKGKKCYKYSLPMYYPELYYFITDVKCPAGSTKIYSGSKFVWSNETYDSNNIKYWSTNWQYFGSHHKDGDGLDVYELYSNNVPIFCAKEYNAEADAYKVYTVDEIKSTACPNGGTLKIFGKNQGYICDLNVKPQGYAWNVSCEDSAYSIKVRDNSVSCVREFEREDPITPVYSCNNGSMNKDGKTCTVTDTYYVQMKYSCNDGDIRLSEQTCSKKVITDARVR